MIGSLSNHDRYPQRKLGGRREERYPTSWDAPAPTLCVGGESTAGRRSGGASSPIHPAFYEGSAGDTENHVNYPLTQAQYEHSRSHQIGYNDSYDKPARIVRAKAENILDVSERKGTVSIRNYNVTPQLPPNSLTVAELFCGGGLMAVGLKAAGFTLTWANDFDKQAVKAYAANIGPHVVHGDITDPAVQDTLPYADIYAGGPPCQDYSVAGSGAGEAGERGRLVWTYLSIIERKQPKAFVFENVKGLVSKRHRLTFDALLKRFDEIGYNVSWRLINAWDYGVAQKRERVFIVGVRKDLGFAFTFPEPDPALYRTQVLRDVIGDLPEPGVKLSDKAIGYLTRDPRHLQKHRPPTLEEASPTLSAVLHKGVPYGLFYLDNHERKDISDKALDGYARRYGGEEVGGFGFRINEWAEPSPTIFGRIFNEGKAFVHPETKPQPRRFTVRECLRIQSVPDSYVLPADISLSAQYRIVGNGVASRVSYVLGVALAEQLRQQSEVAA